MSNAPETLIDSAIADLRNARAKLRMAGAVKTLARVNAALKSADGARRHAGLADIRAGRKGVTHA
jgi:hypothetical protein